MFIHFGLGFGVYGKAYFLPLMIKSLGYSERGGRLHHHDPRDRRRDRHADLLPPLRPHRGAGVAPARALLPGRRRPAARGRLLSAINPWLCIAAFSLSSFGISGALPVFWNLPTAFLGTAAAASGLAAINSVGNISGYVAPQLVGLLRDATGGYRIPMVIVGLVVLMAGIAVPLAARAAEARRPATTTARATPASAAE